MTTKHIFVPKQVLAVKFATLNKHVRFLSNCSAPKQVDLYIFPNPKQVLIMMQF